LIGQSIKIKGSNPRGWSDRAGRRGGRRVAVGRARPIDGPGERGGSESSDQALAACLAAAVGLYSLLAPPTQPESRPASTVFVVRTVPLAEAHIVTTATMTPSPATAQGKVLFVTTAAANIEVVQTDGQAMQMLTDQQLLDLFYGQPVAVVTISPGERRLVLLSGGEQPR